MNHASLRNASEISIESCHTNENARASSGCKNKSSHGETDTVRETRTIRRKEVKIKFQGLLHSSVLFVSNWLKESSLTHSCSFYHHILCFRHDASIRAPWNVEYLVSLFLPRRFCLRVKSWSLLRPWPP